MEAEKRNGAEPSMLHFNSNQKNDAKTSHSASPKRTFVLTSPGIHQLLIQTPLPQILVGVKQQFGLKSQDIGLP